MNNSIPYIGTDLCPGSSSRAFTRRSRCPSTPYTSWHMSNTLSWTLSHLTVTQKDVGLVLTRSPDEGWRDEQEWGRTDSRDVCDKSSHY